MPQQPTTSTDRLADVIEVIQLGRKTGILTAERVRGSVLEQGVITFVGGQVLQASVGHHKGFPAFSVLKTWGACRFAFTPSDPHRLLNHCLLFQVIHQHFGPSPQTQPCTRGQRLITSKRV